MKTYFQGTTQTDCYQNTGRNRRRRAIANPFWLSLFSVLQWHNPLLLYMYFPRLKVAAISISFHVYLCYSTTFQFSLNIIASPKFSSTSIVTSFRYNILFFSLAKRNYLSFEFLRKLAEINKEISINQPNQLSNQLSNQLKSAWKSIKIS